MYTHFDEMIVCVGVEFSKILFPLVENFSYLETARPLTGKASENLLIGQIFFLIWEGGSSNKLFMGKTVYV